MICYIPTKNRFKTKTYKLFEEAGIECYHFIEPKEYDSYDVPNKVNIQKDDKGISYVRNFMLKHAKKKKDKWVIFCDDDVTSFGVYNGKTVKKGASIWHDIYKTVKNLPFEVIGINYTQHAWHEKTSYSINRKFAEVCVLINVDKIEWEYVKGMKQDRQFCLETIKNGYGVLRFNHFWFSCPDVGTNKGGLFDDYKNNKDAKAAQRLVREYYPYAKIVNKKERIEAKIDIKGYAQSLNKIIK